jgi:hypothetical protein
MSQRDSDFFRGGGIEGGEGSALPDASRSTAEFRAFASRMGGETEAPWAMRAPGRRIALLAGIIIAVAVVLILIAFAVIG